MAVHDLHTREGYAKAILDLIGITERWEPGMKALKANNFRGMRGVLLCVWDNLDAIMSLGDAADMELVEKRGKDYAFRLIVKNIETTEGIG